MKSHDNVCTGCSTGCSIHVDENHDQVFRLRPRENEHINKWWMCDEGRYGFKHVHEERRLVEARRREGDELVPIEWSEVATQLQDRLAAAGRPAVVLSPHLTCEEAYLLAKLARQIDEEAMVALGPVPVVGQDERFLSGFTIRAEKCPNRRGIEEIVAYFMRGACDWDDVLKAASAGEIGSAWITGGYKEPWQDEAAAETLCGLDLLIVQDLFPSSLSEVADYVLPAAAFPEREGSYVNHADRLQSVRWAIRPPAGVKVEGRLYWDMLGQGGMYNARAALSEIATQIAYFAAAADPIPPTGVDLRIPLLAIS
jgi:NADH-quinone oxidoreductase subunit G